jgi:hypothetical protein
MRKYLIWVCVLWFFCFSVFAQNFTVKPPMGAPVNWRDKQVEGLVSWWLFQEGGGNKVNDIGPGGWDYTGTFIGFTWPNTVTSGWNPGRFGRTLAFITDDHIDCRFPPTLRESFTISIWCKFNGYVGNATPISHTSGAVAGWMIYSGGAGNQMSFFVYNYATDFATDPSTFPLNEWIHWAGVSDPVYTSLYRNGVLVSRVTKGAGAYNHTTTKPLFLGRYSTNFVFYNGMLDDARVYNVAKTADEIYDIYSDPYRPFRRFIPVGYPGVPSAIGQVIMIH